ncbi:Xylose isomerase-like TIM barrel [Pseudoruegeria aquimaris]|uniref:Xylose isomerase-like TIM barrel n=1 Tax=Pseudoruegeria aquimaris TaxID=393663 RepID=A0A1Y5SW95_9RHOB|nr:sugar phosphate isomerase/epimerase [Pseudoruegeria aquimaris]SLN49896.1 Xylose isomerase-like TIM barrel [Pseudoruegeria aquimaris]
MTLSFQLYSARNFTPWDDVFRTISALGYEAVEGYGALYGDTDKVRAAMDATGLSMPTAHVGLIDLENDLAGVVKIARTLGIEAIFAPYLDASERPSDSAGWSGFAKRLDAVANSLAGEGIAFGWHNHDFEVIPQADGSIPLKVILDDAPGLAWEADIAWIERGGADVMAWIDSYGGRINAIHVKDIAPEGENADEDGWADVGEGVMDWKAILNAVKTKTPAKYFVMEHDNPNDLTRFATRSINNLKTFG